MIYFVNNDSDGAIPEIDLSIKIKPYMFEPIKESNVTQIENDSSSSSVSSDGEPGESGDENITTSYYEYIQENGQLEENEHIHELYRYFAYRKFVRWVYQRLGKKNRRILPSCVVTKIRKTFPSQQYCGFKYPN
ncbi:uncharacterized protein LOC133198423 [Saccostrea echinata]|uniref:uncharacterized protein LOC133198423 n=1 Tax=Saccostrea echinata TaxID=191078 RepID=UPI002A814CCE|nr:uncharacterized protein LOC133198423 [Saccostrea echinata]